MCRACTRLKYESQYLSRYKPEYPHLSDDPSDGKMVNFKIAERYVRAQRLVLWRLRLKNPECVRPAKDDGASSWTGNRSIFFIKLEEEKEVLVWEKKV